MSLTPTLNLDLLLALALTLTLTLTLPLLLNRYVAYDNLQLSISDSSFARGLALLDGGALYLYQVKNHRDRRSI